MGVEKQAARRASASSSGSSRGGREEAGGILNGSAGSGPSTFGPGLSFQTGLVSLDCSYRGFVWPEAEDFLTVQALVVKGVIWTENASFFCFLPEQIAEQIDLK